MGWRIVFLYLASSMRKTQSFVSFGSSFLVAALPCTAHLNVVICLDYNFVK